MPVPTHGPDCYSKAVKLTCYYCDRDIYYFFCNHGTKVFFEALGHPWPIHRCREHEIIEAINDRFGVIDSSVRRSINILSEERGIEVDSYVIEIIETHISRNAKQQRIVRIAPNSRGDLILGKVININKDINFYKKYGFDNNFLSKQLLGILSQESFSEITIREKPDNNNEIRELSAYLPTKLIQLLKIRINTPIIMKVLMHTTIKDDHIWLVDNINLMDGQ